jgi:hypothetical protein
MDWPGMLGKLYELARGFVPMMAQGAKTPIDVSKLPTAEQLFACFRPSFSWSKRVDGRIYTRSESSFGPETPLALGMVAYAATRATPQAARPETSSDTPSSPPVAEASAPDEKLKATTRALRTVKTGLAVFKTQKSAYPAKLDELLAATDAFPKGFLEGGVSRGRLDARARLQALVGRRGVRALLARIERNRRWRRGRRRPRAVSSTREQATSPTARKRHRKIKRFRRRIGRWVALSAGPPLLRLLSSDVARLRRGRALRRRRARRGRRSHHVAAGTGAC